MDAPSSTAVYMQQQGVPDSWEKTKLPNSPRLLRHDSLQHRHDRETQAVECDVIPNLLLDAIQGKQFGYQGSTSCVRTDFKLATNKIDFINVLMGQGIAVQAMIMEGLLCHVIVAVADRSRSIVQCRLSHDDWKSFHDYDCKDITDACNGVHAKACSRLFMVSIQCSGRTSMAFSARRPSGGDAVWDNNMSNNFNFVSDRKSSVVV